MSRAPDGPARAGARSALILPLAFALLTALLELLYRVMDGKGDVMVVVHPTAGWMTPLAYVVLFGVTALGVAVATRWRRLREWRFDVLVYGGLAAFSLLVMWGRLTLSSSMILALGIAVVLGRWARARPGQLDQ
ncbi:MAG TPA: hypothetical protein VNH46_05180, partial [Gemmatimonadales bacterium]|nr:hypothetical protein [Gemmatimonadales bacterium]